MNCCREGPCPKDKPDLLLFDGIVHSPGKSVGGWRGLSKQDAFRFAVSHPMKFQKIPLWGALGEASLGAHVSGEEQPQHHTLRKSQEAES